MWSGCDGGYCVVQPHGVGHVVRAVTIGYSFFWGGDGAVVLIPPPSMSHTPPGIGSEWCWCISTTWVAFSGQDSMSSCLALYAENAFDFRIEVCHRVRARMRTRLRHLRGTTPGFDHIGAPLDGRFGWKAISQSSPVECFRPLGRVEILANVPKRLLGAFSQAIGAFPCLESLHPMPKCILVQSGPLRSTARTAMGFSAHQPWFSTPIPR